MIVNEEFKVEAIKSQKQEKGKPTIIQWKEASLIRGHSLGATVQEILNAVSVQDSQDVCNINLIGDPSSGKTTLAETLAHLIHKRSKIPFAVRMFGKKQLLDFKNTLKSLHVANWILIFDDLSFLKAEATNTQIEMVKQATTEIRHLPGGQDVKIIIIKNFHYTKGLDKYLRQNDFTYFTTIGSEEIGNVEDIVGERYMNKVKRFVKMRNSIKLADEGKKRFVFKLKPNKPPFIYKYKDPFIPLLYWNGNSLRFVVSPKRQWIDKVCQTCTVHSTNEKLQNEVDLKKLKEHIDKSEGESTAKRAVLNILQQNGITADRKRVVGAELFIKKLMSEKNINLDDLANTFDIIPTNTQGLNSKKNMKEVIEMISIKEDGVTNGDTGIP